MRSLPDNPVRLNVFAHDGVQIPNPGAGNTADLACPVNARIRITALRLTIVNVGAARFPTVLIVPAAGSDIRVALADSDIDNLATTQVAACSGIRETFHSSPDDELVFPLPPDVLLEPGDTLRITVTNMSAAQSLSNIWVSYDQWIIP